jgi:ribosomal-protein-alanine N-acetyltransferase
MATYINIREATETDYSRMIEIEKISFESDTITVEELEDYVSYGCNVNVLQVNDDIAGFYISYVHDDEHEQSEYLETLEIDPQYRGQGYSKLLLQHYINSKSIPWSPLTLHCRVENTVALSLYDAYGFTIIELVLGFYDDGGNAYKLVRR